MKTAEEVIAIVRELPREERQKVAEYLNADGEKFLEENYSPEDIAKILQSGEEAERGINMSGPFVGEEAINHLRRLRKANF